MTSTAVAIPPALRALAQAALYPPNAAGETVPLGAAWTVQDLVPGRVPFGFRQARAGPCGALAALQCEVARFLLFGPVAAIGAADSLVAAAAAIPAAWWTPRHPHPSFDECVWPPPPSVASRCLLLAMASIIWRCLPATADAKPPPAVLVVQTPDAGAAAAATTTVRVHGRAYAFRDDAFTRRLVAVPCASPAALAAALEAHAHQYTGKGQPSLALLLYSMILTRRVLSTDATVTAVAADVGENGAARGGTTTTAAAGAAALPSVSSDGFAHHSAFAPCADTIWCDMDTTPLRQSPQPEPSLLGADHYCENDVVAFMLCGRAVSFVFNGTAEVPHADWASAESATTTLASTAAADASGGAASAPTFASDYVHHVTGIPHRPVCGLLSYDEPKIMMTNPVYTLHPLTPVGSYLKHPLLPLWVLHFNDHYVTALVPPASLATAMVVELTTAGAITGVPVAAADYFPDADRFVGAAVLPSSASSGSAVDAGATASGGPVSPPALPPAFEVLVYDQLGSNNLRGITCFTDVSSAAAAAPVYSALACLPPGTTAIPPALTYVEALAAALRTVWGPALTHAEAAFGLDEWQTSEPFIATHDGDRKLARDRQPMLL